MEYTTLGQTGVTVSRIRLGCMSFGSTDWRSWVLEADESRPIIERAIDLGINFFDTANVYSRGESEQILGDVIADYDRNGLVVATTVHGVMDESNPNASGLSRKAIASKSSRTASTASASTPWTSTRPTGGTQMRRSRRHSGR